MTTPKTTTHRDGLDLAACPQCGAPAEVVDRFHLASTGGPMEHVTVRCVRRHGFMMLAQHLPVAAPDAGKEPERWIRASHGS